MILFLLRGLFILMSALVAALYGVKLLNEGKISPSQLVLVILGAIAVAGFLVAIDAFTKRKKLSAFSGVVLGLLAGLVATYAFSFIVEFIGVLFQGSIPDALLQGVNVFVGVIFVYIFMSLVMQTKDDFRFVLPYVEFAKQIRGTRPMLLDSSAIIDGRILDIVQTQILQGMLVVPRFILNELQLISDSSDKLKRARGRRGLDIVAKLQANPVLEVLIDDTEAEGATVDQQLVSLAQDLHARVITTDFNLTKVAEVRGVDVININSLAEALRPVVLPGEQMGVKIVKPGESGGQGVGYLDDGTMVVVEDARRFIGSDIALTVTSVLQTSAGRMIFGRYRDSKEPAPSDADAAAPAEQSATTPPQ